MGIAHGKLSIFNDEEYMPKPCYPRELVARLRAVLRRFDEHPELSLSDNILIYKGYLAINPSTCSSE